MPTADRQNVTLSLPRNLLRTLRHRAVDQGTSLSGFILQILRKEVEEKEGYALAMERQARLMRNQVIFLPSGSQAIVQRVTVPSAKDLRGVLPASRPYPGREVIIEEAEQMAADEVTPRPVRKSRRKSKA